MSLTDLFNEADALYQYLLKTKGSQDGWSVVVFASFTNPWQLYTDEPPLGQLTYSPYRVDVSQANAGRFKEPFALIVPAAFSGEITGLSVPITPPMQAEYPQVSVTVSSPSLLSMQSNTYNVDYAYQGQPAVSTGPFPDVSPYVVVSSTSLSVIQEGLNFAVSFYGSPAQHPPMVIKGVRGRPPVKG